MDTVGSYRVVLTSGDMTRAVQPAKVTRCQAMALGLEWTLSTLRSLGPWAGLCAIFILRDSSGLPALPRFGEPFDWLPGPLYVLKTIALPQTCRLFSAQVVLRLNCVE